MPHIVDTGTTAFGIQHLGGDEQAIDSLTQSGTRVAVTTMVPAAQQRRSRAGVERCGEAVA